MPPWIRLVSGVGFGVGVGVKTGFNKSGLRRLLKMKNQELRQMKSLAATILSQRSETEQFFLEALEEVGGLWREHPIFMVISDCFLHEFRSGKCCVKNGAERI